MEHTKKFDTFTKFAEADAVQLESPEKEWLDQVYEKIETKMQWVSEKSKDKIPYLTINGTHDDRGDLSKEWRIDDGLNWWTNGFWGGILWMLYQASGKERYAEIARISEEKMDACFDGYYGLHHDVGFMWRPTAAADYDLTHNKESRKRALHAANLLAGRFNPVGQYIRAWNDISGSNDDTRGWAIIDCMLNLSLLYWASEETGDPRFRHIAMLHADTAQKYFVRPDGSVNHIIEFNPETGEFVRAYGGQGYTEGSSWTRGQGWGVYGFMISYIHTGKQEYFDTAKRIAHYIMAIDTRIKATAAMTMYDMTRVNANGYFDSEDSEQARFEKKKAMNAQRTEDYRSGTYALAGGVVDPLPEDAPQFVKDYYAYYKTPRGYHPRSLNSNGGWNVTSSLSFLNMPILQYSSEIRCAVLLVHGEKAHSRYFSETAYSKLTGDNKELLIIPGANHTDLYDQIDVIPFEKLKAFFEEYLK